MIFSHNFQQLKHINFEITLILIAAFLSTANLYFYCYFGKIASESYEQMGDCLFFSNWVELPLELQKYFIVMIGNTQRPLYYHGFGIANMKLETFSIVTFLIFFQCKEEIKLYQSTSIFFLFTGNSKCHHFLYDVQDNFK